MDYAIVKITAARPAPKVELLRIMHEEKSSVQYCRELNNGVHFMENIHHSVVELLGEGEAIVFVHDMTCRMAKRFDTVDEATQFMKNKAPKMGFPRSWKFTLLAKDDPEQAQEDDEAPPLPEEEPEDLLGDAATR